MPNDKADIYCILVTRQTWSIYAFLFGYYFSILGVEKVYHLGEKILRGAFYTEVISCKTFPIF